MVNLRLIDYQVVDSRNLKLTFSESLDTIINVENITITSLTKNVPDVNVISINVKSELLYVKTAPLTPQAIYRVTLASTIQHPIRSIIGSMLFEDGTTNAPLIQGTHNPANFFFDRMISYLKDTPYDTENPGLVRSYIDTTSSQLLKAYNDIRQSKTDNYLSITVTDELHKRGKGPFDRLLNEGAYEIIRVGLNKTGTTNSNTLDFLSFPSEPISLQQEIVTSEKLFFGSKKIAGTFNEAECTLAKSNVIKITKVFIQYQDGSSTIYDLDAYGYQLQTSRYDVRSSTYFLLDNNQFKFSEKAISSGFRIPAPGDNITVDYVYKQLGRTIDDSTISIYTICKTIRKVCPPLMTSFSLGHTLLCDSLGTLVTINGVSFLDPLATPPFSKSHPAFQKEITFDETKLPIHAGEYSVDYTNGKVYVYGVDNKDNVGTGMFPPVVTFFYRQLYSQKIDYNFNTTLGEIVANSTRDLIGKKTIITYDFSDDLVPDVDYVPQIHKEELSERVENRVIGNGAIQTLHSPITNAFRVYNETSGEVYGINRFNDNVIYFSYQTPPLFISLINERVRFDQISGSMLVKADEFVNTNGFRIFQFELGTLIIASTDDSMGSSINTSLLFTNGLIFQDELYYARDATDTENVDKLNNFGEYVVNYTTGTIWLATSGTQTDDVGAVSYRSKYIVTNSPHISAVNQVYSIINEEGGKTKYPVNAYSDTMVDLISYPSSDNLSNIVGGNIIELSEDALGIRHIYDLAAIANNASDPVDFGANSTVDYTTVTVNPVEIFTEATVDIDGVTIIVPKLTYVDSKVVISSISSIQLKYNGAEVYNTTLANGTFLNNTITLPSDTTATAGDDVLVRVFVTIVNTAGVIVDYNRGEMYIDYIYCNDEIIVSYEHGDNCLDFRESNTVTENKVYYVSYKYGALRDALFANFGSLIDIDILHNFNVDLDRERYRDAIMACLQTFPKGPQVQAINNIAKIMSHVDPNIWESFNDEWIIGLSHLYNNDAIEVGPLEILPGKFDYAVNVTDPTDTILMPFSSHFKLERGTLEMFVTPSWNGLDNNAILTLTITRDNVIVPASNIWIGYAGKSPTLDYTNSFTVEKDESSYGVPANIASSHSSSWGVYIYYDVNEANWKILFKDFNATMLFSHDYQATIKTSGEFYNVKPLLDVLNVGDKITTISKQVVVSMTIDSVESDGYIIDGYAPSPFSFDGIKLMSDQEHFFFDYMADPSKPNENRISILKDGRGYLTFKVYSKRDLNHKAHVYQVSKDISNWKNGDTHFIAASWRIATKNKRDEIHLFVDEQETANILKYGGRPVASNTDRFRTVVPEILSAPAPNNTLTNIDLIITNGSDIVVSKSSDFGIAGIPVGSKFYIDNPVINGPDGYFTITEIVTGDSVRLNYTFNFNMTDVGFTVNPWSTPVSTNVMYESNIAVSIVQPGGTEIELAGLRAPIPSYSVDVDSFGQPHLTLKGNVSAGDRIAIRTLGLNHRRIRERVYNWGTLSNQINTQLPAPINLDHAKIIPIILSRTSVNSSVPNYATEMEPSSDMGRTLELIVSNTSNCNFVAQPIIITITGTTYSGATSEILSISAAGYYTTTEQFITIANIACSVVAYNPVATAFSLEVREAYSITAQENNGYFAVLRYSYKEGSLSGLSGDTNTITSTLPVFDNTHVGFVISLSLPLSVAGLYTIEEVVDAYNVTVTQTLPTAFTSGSADLYNISIARSGYANGLFTFEKAGYAGTPLYLKQGYYDLDYATYLEMPFEIIDTNFAIGSDKYGDNQAKSIIEELRSLDVLSTDTRIGEVLAEGERSITSDCNTVNAYTPDERTLLLMHFNEKPFVDSSVAYQSNSGEYFQTDEGVNSNFLSSLCVDYEPLLIDNTNIFFNKEGTIEFWISPKFDTANDPVYRMYFDSTSSHVEKVTSLTRRDVILNSAAKYIVSIVVEGFPNVNYADGCTISTNGKSIQLGKELPNSSMNLLITYIPFRSSGDRVSIYKTPTNTINFDIIASGKLFSLSTPAFWPRDTWHKITAMWKCNTKNKQDEMHLLVDGTEKNKIIFGLGLNFGSNYKFTQLMTSNAPTIKTTINLRETFNKLFIGGNSFGGEIAHARFDNFKISRKMKQLVSIANRLTDNDYSSDTSSVLPVVEDVYTTFLMDFENSVEKVEDFTILKNQITGVFDFELDVIDSFGIIEANPKAKEILNILIKKLKPAVSRSFIKYIK